MQYFIYKSIILRNLNGVDIMHEATEIARLRLFLKMVAVVDVDRRADNLGLDPLPDIDFNIRCGNTLIGYATQAELEKDLTYGDMFANLEFREKIEEEMDKTSRAYKLFKEIQFTQHEDMDAFKEAKNQLNTRLSSLNNELNKKLYASTVQGNSLTYSEWLSSHQPFHWLAEFYEIINGNGGFDVIIGNPPYVELSNLKNYDIKKHPLSNCGNLYALIIHRSNKISCEISNISFIVPLSLSSSSRMKSLQKTISEIGRIWISNFEGGTNPSVMFNGVKQNLSILIWRKSEQKNIYTTKIYRFFSEERGSLFQLLKFTVNESTYIEYGYPKISTTIEKIILNKLFSKQKLVFHISKLSKNKIFIHRIASYYIKCFNQQPYFKNDRDGVKKSEDYKIFYFNQNTSRYISILSSSTFYIYWLIFFDSFKVGKYSIENFPIGEFFEQRIIENLDLFGNELMQDVVKNSKRMSVFYKNTGNVEYDQYFPRLSKSIMDKADFVLAQHYGFTQEELDFIINYDIKYRMGSELNAEEEE